MTELEHQLLEADVIRYQKFITAGGQPAEVKVELECLDPHSDVFREDIFALTVGRLAAEAVELRPDFLVSAPHGADGLTAAVSEELEIPFLVPKKIFGTKQVAEPDDAAVKKQIGMCSSGIIIDDVLTSGSTMKRIAELPMLNDKIIGGVVVWDRFPHLNLGLPFPTRAIINRYVPLMREKV